jgi:tetrahydromethanopterin S-methyltransferase subunit B
MTAFRRTQLIRLGVWIGLATVAVLATVLAARTETGVRRIATLLTPPAADARTTKAPVQLANRQSDQEAEQRRLSETVRTLAADRDRLMARINTLERSLDDVTGSIPPAPTNPKPPAPASPATAAAPLPAIPPTPQANAAAPNQARVAAGHLATGSPTAAESVATRTEFGVDVGGNASIEGLRAAWTALKTSQPALFEGLRPILAVREGKTPGQIELRLIAGPLPNASIAARLCAALSAANQTCQPTVFDGQRLALQ